MTNSRQTPKSTKYYYRQKTTKFLEYFSKFYRRIINEARYIHKIKSKNILVKEAFSNMSLFISANSIEK